MQNIINTLLAVGVVGLIGWVLIKPNPTATTQTTIEEPSPMPTSKANVKSAKQYEKAETVTKKGKSYSAIIKTTAGDITVELSKETPITTNNFVFLAKEKFYEGVIFHRVISGFMIQGGDPTGTGMGDPGYKFADEPFAGDYKKGTIAMANSGPNTNGSQFFIMHTDYPLPPNYTIFGKTTAGLDVVDKIATTKTGPNDRPVEAITIKSVEIIEK